VRWHRGRTTLAGEGLQHQDGHSLLLSSFRTCLCSYDPAYAYEIAVIIEDGIRACIMSRKTGSLHHAVQRELPMPPMPRDWPRGRLKGIYRLKRAGAAKRSPAFSGRARF